MLICKKYNNYGFLYFLPSVPNKYEIFLSAGNVKKPYHRIRIHNKNSGSRFLRLKSAGLSGCGTLCWNLVSSSLINADKFIHLQS
jgi:hypothetical protein